MASKYSEISAIIIDHNSSMRQIMMSMLRAMGLKRIEVANTQKQCLDIVATEKIDLIVCGWSPPKLDALAILNQIRSSEKTINIPFIIVSSIIEQEQITQAILDGVSEYLVPPFNQKIFADKITKALKLPIKITAKNVAPILASKTRTNIAKKSDLSVLIVDDVAENIEIIKNVVRDVYHVKAALNAQAALKICLSDSPPDLILLDIIMPEIDGLTLCKELKKNPLTQNIVVIFITALAETADVVKGLSLGAVDYITKPIVPEILLARLNVHSSLIMNQRTIQIQIDNLLRTNSISLKLKSSITKYVKDFLTIAKDGVEQLQRANRVTAIPSCSEQINYAIGLSDSLVDSRSLFEELENNQYQITRNKHQIEKLISSVINIFSFVIHENNLEHHENFKYNGPIICDENLFSLLLIHLYRNAVDAAPKGSRVSVETKKIDNFILIKIHNIGQIADEVIDKFDQLFVSSKKEEGSGIGVYLAYLIINKMKGRLYYHSSEKYGTTFYIKLML